MLHQAHPSADRRVATDPRGGIWIKQAMETQMNTNEHKRTQMK
jgi:hypothetical protein